MGGDIVYRLPRKAWRPGDQTMGYAMGYRALVAHSRRAPSRDAATPPAAVEEAPPPATPEEAAGPVVPLTGPAAPRPVSAGDGDGGVAVD